MLLVPEQPHSIQILSAHDSPALDLLALLQFQGHLLDRAIRVDQHRIVAAPAPLGDLEGEVAGTRVGGEGRVVVFQVLVLYTLVEIGDAEGLEKGEIVDLIIIRIDRRLSSLLFFLLFTTRVLL